MKHNPFKMIGPRVGALVGAAFILWVRYFNNKVFGCPAGGGLDSNGFMQLTDPCLLNLNPGGAVGFFNAPDPFMGYLIIFTVVGFLLGWLVQTIIKKVKK